MYHLLVYANIQYTIIVPWWRSDHWTAVNDLQGCFPFRSEVFFGLCCCHASSSPLAAFSEGDPTPPSLQPHNLHNLQSPPLILSPRRCLLHPLTSINVTVHQCSTLSHGRRENMINKFNYP